MGGAENSLLEGSGLSTLICPPKGAATGAISKFTNNNHSNKERALLKAVALLRTMADRLNVPSSIVDKASSLFKRVHQMRKLKGRSHDTISAAVLYIACRQESVPRAFKEVVAVSERSLKQVSRCFTLIKNELSLELETATSNDFMARFSASLNLSKEVEQAARLLLWEKNKHGLNLTFMQPQVDRLERQGAGPRMWPLPFVRGWSLNLYGKLLCSQCQWRGPC